MKNKSIKRDYNFSDATLLIMTKEKMAFMQRDSAVFETFGITPAHFSALENELDAFINLETDIEIKGNQTVLTDAKKQKAEALIEAIQTVMTIVSLRFKKNTPRYRAYSTADITLRPNWWYNWALNI